MMQEVEEKLSHKGQELYRFATTLPKLSWMPNSKPLFSEEERELLFSIKLKIQFVLEACPISGDLNIKNAIFQCFLDLIEGKATIQASKEKLASLKAQDLQKAVWESPNYVATFIVFLALGAACLVGCGLILGLKLLLWPLIPIFLAPVGIVFFAGAAGLMISKKTMDEERISKFPYWANADNFFKNGNTELPVAQAEALFQKIHSESWRLQFSNHQMLYTARIAKAAAEHAAQYSTTFSPADPQAGSSPSLGVPEKLENTL
jgi:hypothetical protein